MVRFLLFLLFSLLYIPISVYAQNAKWLVKPHYDHIDNYVGDVAAVQVDGKWGYINKAGVEFIPCKYENITPFVNGISIATEPNGKLIAIIHDDGTIISKFVDLNGNELSLSIDPRYPNFEEDLLLVTNGLMQKTSGEMYRKWGYLDKNGRLRLDIQYLAAMPFSEGLAGVASGKMVFSYINSSGDVAINEDKLGGRQVAGAMGFHKGEALICGKKELFYIDKSGARLEKQSPILVFVPNVSYYDIKSNVLHCEQGNITIDSKGRFATAEFFKPLVIYDILNEETEVEKDKGAKPDTYFILNKERISGDTLWTSANKKIVKRGNKLGIVEVVAEPIISVEFASDTVASIFGNTEPLEFAIKNNTNAAIDSLVIKLNGEVIDISSLPVSGYQSSIKIDKLSNSASEISTHNFEITQLDVELLNSAFDIDVVDVPSILIGGGRSQEEGLQDNTYKMVVAVENTSDYPLEDAFLSINNFQQVIYVEPKARIEYSSIFGINPGEKNIKVMISVKPKKSPSVTRTATIVISDTQSNE